jgi:hypothetical protein
MKEIAATTSRIEPPGLSGTKTMCISAGRFRGRSAECPG